MGYTHYWTPAKFTETQWEGVMADVVKTLDHPELKGLLCFDYNTPSKPPEVNAEFIRFNGKGNDGHETFYYKNGGDWIFCKTARKDYDAAVCAVLCIIAYHSKAHGLPIEISSDGGWSDWDRGRVIALLATGYEVGNFIDEDVEDD